MAVQGVSKAFGGIQAVRGLQLRRGAAAHHRADRPQRRRQDHGVQPHHRLPARRRAAPSATRARSCSACAPHEVEARGVVRTFQHLRLWSKMTRARERAARLPRRRSGENVLTLFLRAGRVRAEEAAARERAMEVLEFFGLAGARARARRGPGLPGAEAPVDGAHLRHRRRRSCCSTSPPRGSTPNRSRRIVPMVRRLVEHGKTVLLIEHNMELISQLSDEVVFLHQGRVMARGARRARSRAIRRSPRSTSGSERWRHPARGARARSRLRQEDRAAGRVVARGRGRGGRRCSATTAPASPPR